MSRESKILGGVLIAVVAVMIGLFALANQGEKPSTAVGDKTKIVREDSHSQGSGPVQLVEFGDYQCPACGSAHPNIVQLMKEYDGKVTFFFRNFPLTNVHKNAMAAANAAESAADQDKFWQMHDLLYEKQKEWSDITDPTNKFTEYAKSLGMDEAKFKKSITDKQFQSIIDQDAADATALSLQSTPTFFINGVQHQGSFDYATLKAAVDAALAQQPAAASPAASPAP